MAAPLAMHVYFPKKINNLKALIDGSTIRCRVFPIKLQYPLFFKLLGLFAFETEHTEIYALTTYNDF